MKLLKYLFIAVLTAPIILHAEGGSIYSRLGVGELHFASSARRIGIGELGVAVFDRDFLGTINPAGWSKLNLTRFETALNFQNFKEQSVAGSNYHSVTNFSGALIGVPVERDLGISFVGGIVPYSSTNYKVVEKNLTGSYPNVITYEGSGNISKAFIGGSYTTPFDVSIGASFDYYVGKNNYTSAIEFQNTSLYGSQYQKTYKTAGLGGSFGLISNDFSKLLKLDKVSNLRIGLALNYASSFNSDTSYIQYNSNGSDTLSSGKTDAEIPLRFAAGINFIYNNSLLVTLDYLYQPWNNYKFGNQSSANLRSIQKISAGVEYRNPDMRENSFWQRTMLRGGLSYEQTQFQVNGQGINEYSIYGGFSFPLEYENSIDIALQYGIRGTTDLNLIKENIFRANVTLSLGELWFFRPQR